MLANYADYIAANARAEPDKVAVRDATASLTYAGLDTLVTQSALELRARGVTPGEIVGVCLPDTAMHVVMLLAVARAGGVILPMDHRWTAAEAARIAAQFGIRRMLAAPGREPPPGAEAVTLDASWHAAVAAQPGTGDFPTEPGAAMLLSMSSGTTGTPKGPLSTHAAQIGRALAGLIRREDVVFMATPLYFGGGRGFALAGLLRGATVVLFPPPFQPGELAAAMQSVGATYGFLVPTQLRKLLELPDDGRLVLPTLRMLICSGAVLYPEERAAVMRRLSPHLVNLYSSTEGGSVASLGPEHQGEKAGSVGRVFPHIELQIVGEDDRVLPNGEVGRIRHKGPTLPAGFYNNPEETAKHFRDGWYYPGDLGRLDDDGFLYLAGRAKEMIIRGGVNIYPGEIEEPLLALPQVHDCAAVAWSSPMLGEEIALFVVPAGAVTEADVMQACRAILAPYKVPRQVFFLDELPKNGQGKVVRAILAGRLPKLDPPASA